MGRMYIICVGQRTACRIFVRIREARDHLRAVGIDGRVMLEGILKIQRLKLFSTR
jgi:hypothetical protein